MPIRFIVNDPQSEFDDIRIIKPHQGRPDDRASVRFVDAVSEDLFDVGTDEFLFWQCREAALRGLDMWETIAGPLTAWVSDQQHLNLIPRANGNVPNAFYDRSSLQFFVFVTANKVFCSGASTDIVTHELGHACLDSIRPQLFGLPFTETGALHEALGDIVAILTALSDQDTRSNLLQHKNKLRKANYVETTAEDLSDGINQGIVDGLISSAFENAAAPRHALNSFQWQIPFELPTTGAPGTLINEIHSFGQIFSGCIYDLIVILYENSSQQDEAALWEAAKSVGNLLITACGNAPIVPRFFKSVGQAMIFADNEQNGGVNGSAIERAFGGHGIDLSAQAMLSPTETLSGRAPALEAEMGSNIITRSSRRDIVETVGETEGQRFFVRPAHIGATDLAIANHRYFVPLDDVAEELEGVEAPVAADILIGEESGHAAILGSAPSVQETQREVLHFVRSLVDQGRIGPGKETGNQITHRVVKSGTRRVLRRVGYSCFLAN